jgi:uncharacterized protein
MRVVMDTNCFLQILPKNSKYRPIFDLYRLSNLEFAISNEILEEYSEKFSEKMNPEISNNIIELILENTNSIFTDIFYRWNLIQMDFDDNKFVDTAISSNSNYIITNDSHFKILKSLDFPIVNVINLDELLAVLIPNQNQ